MAKGTKPGDKSEEQAETATPKKSKKKLIIIIVALVLVIAVAAVAALLLLKPDRARKGDAEGASVEHVEEHKLPPKFVELGTFTTNLAPDEGSHFVQASISLKISKPELEEEIKNSKPELQHIINMLLQSKLPSELGTTEGRIELAEQIKVQTQEVLGLRKPAAQHDGAPDESGGTASKPKEGLDEVLFTSFLIQ